MQLLVRPMSGLGSIFAVVTFLAVLPQVTLAGVIPRAPVMGRDVPGDGNLTTGYTDPSGFNASAAFNSTLGGYGSDDPNGNFPTVDQGFPEGNGTVFGLPPCGNMTNGTHGSFSGNDTSVGQLPHFNITHHLGGNSSHDLNGTDVGPTPTGYCVPIPSDSAGNYSQSV